MKQKFAISAISLLLMLLFIEGGIRVYDAFIGPGDGFFSSHRNQVSTSFRTTIPFRIFGSSLYTNEDGVRYIRSRHGQKYPIEKPGGTFRIVAFGGSTTENKSAVRMGGTDYPIEIQSILRQRRQTDGIEVINVGFSAYSTAHSLILLGLDVLSWNPDLIILSHNANDLSATYWPGFTFDYSNKYSDQYYLGDHLTSRFNTTNVLFQHFQTYWVMKKYLGRIVNRAPADPCKYEVDCDVREELRNSYGLAPNPEGRAILKRNLKSFISLAKANGIDVLLASQALRGEAGSARYINPGDKDIVFPEAMIYRSQHNSYNKAIEEVAHEMGVWFLDNAAALTHKDEYFVDTHHYTSEGTRYLAKNYADFLISNGIVK